MYRHDENLEMSVKSNFWKVLIRDLTYRKPNRSLSHSWSNSNKEKTKNMESSMIFDSVGKENQ